MCQRAMAPAAETLQQQRKQLGRDWLELVVLSFSRMQASFCCSQCRAVTCTLRRKQGRAFLVSALWI